LCQKGTDWGSNDFWGATFAYLLGSGGTIASTIPILVQFFKYKKPAKTGYDPLHYEENLIDDESPPAIERRRRRSSQASLGRGWDA